ncbi:MAG TPA: serine/threonine protein kinase [Aridibacter sp.]|nr:serine/threonine protein kinase [Aridibacter sp.]
MKELSLIDSVLDGRYEVRKLLGRGSYAEIYLAEDTLASPETPHRRVVIKALNVFMHDDLDRDLERTLVENFQNEALALDRVRHPNIISRLGHGTAQDLNGVLFHFLVLEFLPGGDLARFSKTHGIGFAEALRFIEQSSAGLSHAHGKNVIHRDIKPQNLLLNGDLDIVKIADFGVARMSESDAPITRVGTNIYAPPEHSPMISGTTGRLGFGELTPAADVYSLAKTAYVLFTSESPRFFANRPIEALPAKVREEPWAESLRLVLKKATDDDPKKRYQGADEFWKELSKIAAFSGDTSSTVRGRHTAVRERPQPVFSPGYSPLTPAKAEFDTERERKLGKVNKEKRPGAGLSVLDPPVPAAPGSHPPATSQDRQAEAKRRRNDDNLFELNQIREGRLLRKVVMALLLIAFFAVGIYATYNYVLTRTTFPSVYALFGQKEATALMNINLRSDASTKNPRIGLVPKASRLRILSSQEHWHEVQIVEYGAPKTDPEFADRGWISGKTRRGEDTISIKGEE